jgi:tetratricopeptide (TPR) repeat protein
VKRHLTVLTLLVAAIFPAGAADSRWTRLRSDNFELYSSAGLRASRDTLKMFEQVRGFFEKVMGPSSKPLPVRLVAFGSAKEFEPYRFNEYATAYYTQTAERDYIVMSRAGADVFPGAVHEYVHLLVRGSKLDLPPWLNEGIAELYSTLRPVGNEVVVGDIIPGRHRALLDDKWVPLQTILAADHNSAYYNEKNKAGSLYNEGWALTHMLNFHPDYRPKFAEVVRAAASGQPSAEALAKIYGRPLDKIERDLQSYLRGGSFKAALFPLKFDRKVEEVASEPLVEFDVDLMFADLVFGPDREEKRAKAFERLATQDPKRPEPLRGLAEAAWRGGRRDEAVEFFAKAYALGDRDPRLLWDYGRLVERKDGEQAARVLAELIKKQPERLEVRLELAEVQTRNGKAQAALETLSTIRKVTPEEAPRFFRVAVYAHLLNGDRANAEANAKRLQDIAKSGEDVAEAENLLRLSAAPPAAVRAPDRVEAAEPERPSLRRPDSPPGSDPSDAKPLLRRVDQPGSAEVAHDALPERPSATGRFVELDCRGAQARMVVETAGGRKVFLIEDPGKVAITAGSQGPVDMTCGPQKPAARVEISYDRPRAGQSGIDGLVRTLAF